MLHTSVHLCMCVQAMALYSEAVSLELFPSVWQRSLINEPGLRTMPWWSLDQLKYATEIQRIEKAIKTITQYVYTVHVVVQLAK